MISKEIFNIDSSERSCIIVPINEAGGTNIVVASAATGFSITFKQPIKELVSAVFQIEGVAARFTPVLAAGNLVINVAVEVDEIGVTFVDPDYVVAVTQADLALGAQKLHGVLVIK